MDEKKKNMYELITYVIVGGITTVINFIVFVICTNLNLHWFFANSIAWIFAVLFAYIANRTYVFKSHKREKKTEFIKFVVLRLVTLGIESMLMFACIQILLMNENISKIIVSFVTVIGNYVFCKLLIFKPKAEKKD